MRFQIGKYYQHAGTGKVIHIIDCVNTFFHGVALLSEDDYGNLSPVGSDDTSAVNWHEVSGWARHTYQANNIPEPRE